MPENRWALCRSKSPYIIGWRITAGLWPKRFSILASFKVRGLLPLPVRTAHTDITGSDDFSIVLRGPRSMKSGPIAMTSEALPITYCADTSL